MKITGLPLILSIFALTAGELHPESTYFIGISRGPAAAEIIFRHYREGAWREEAFPPAKRFDGNFSPALALSPSGELWAAWAARRGGEKPKIYFSRRRGETWTEPRRVTAGEEYWEMTPAIAFGPDGSLLAAWSGERADQLEIYCARWEGDGFGPAVRVSLPGRSPNLHPALAVSSANRAVLAWQGWEEGYYRVFASFSDGRKWSEGKAVARRTGIDQVHPFLSPPRERGWECSWVERGDLLSAAGGEKGWSGPAAARTVPAQDPPRGGEPPLAGWLVEKDSEGTVQSRRVGVTFDRILETPARAAKSGLGNREFIGYGDSITYGTNGPPPGKCYIPLLEAELETAHGEDYTIHNEGYPGANTLYLLSGGGDGDYACPGIDQVLNLYDASHILIMAGTNDWKYGQPFSLSKNNLGAMIDRARNHNCTPVLATIIPPCSEYPDGRYDWHRELSQDYITPLAAEKDCLLADPFQAYLDYGDWDELLQCIEDDGIHPVWPEGSQVISDAWFTALCGSDPLLADSGDYNGDGTSDLAIFRPASGLWAIKDVTRTYFGRSGDIPAPGDFTGDGTTDIALFRPASGLWAVRGGMRVYFGASSDIPVPGDYTGDGTVTPAVFRSAAGLWAVKGLTRAYFGRRNDIPVPFYPEGRAAPKKIAVFRPATGLWAAPGEPRVYFGAADDRPVIGSYAPAGYAALPAVFRPASGLWAVRGVTRTYFGQEGDEPVPGNYTGFFPADIGIFRPATGLWAVNGLTRAYFGASGDIPVSGFSINPSNAAML
jgi:lysophospholipase L1-like esterase